MTYEELINTLRNDAKYGDRAADIVEGQQARIDFLEYLTDRDENRIKEAQENITNLKAALYAQQERNRAQARYITELKDKLYNLLHTPAPEE